MRRRLLLSYLAVALVVLALLEIPLGVAYSRNERQDLTAKVERDAAAVASLSEDALERGSAVPAGVSAIAARYQRDTGGRVVVVDSKGATVIDSSGAALGRDFSTRPEIRRALNGTVASGERHSRTLGTDLLYVAVPVASSGVVHGAARITYPTSAVDERVHRYWLILAGIAAVVLAVTAAVGLGLASWIARPLRRVELAAEAIAGGDLEARAPLAGPPEVRGLAEAFNDMVTKLDALVRSQQAFVADASHQLRTPLTALRLRLENLERHVGRERRGELEGTLAELERLTRLVDGLLTLARADRAPTAPAAVDVGSLVAERVAAWSALAAEREVALVPRVEGAPAARATSGRLEQVLDNLLANALEVSPEGGSIVVSAVRAGQLVELHVADEGPGMSEEERRRAFDRFWRADGSGEGFGLGLAIVRRLVAGDGGTVELRERPSGGLDAVVLLRAAQ